jgi:hypothetical protein
MTDPKSDDPAPTRRVDPYAVKSTQLRNEEVPMPAEGPRVLGFGAHEHVAAAVQDRLRASGMRATAIALADDTPSDDRLIATLAGDKYDIVAIGGFLSGQDPHTPATMESALWFNRVLNIVHCAAPTSLIALVRGPANAVDDIQRILAARSPV